MDYSNTQTQSNTQATTPMRGQSFDTDRGSGNRNPYATFVQNPFQSPFSTRPNSMRPSSSAVEIHSSVISRRWFRSRRINKENFERPWQSKKDPREKWITIIPLIGLFLGIAITGFLVYDGMKSVVNNKYCQILDETWSEGFNTDVWTKEVQVGGFGNGQFEETTNTEENVFIQNGDLYIKPTLQDENLIATNNVINLTSSGTCTSTKIMDCVAVTNTTNHTIVNPVKSGRINTKKGASIKYGRVEVIATIPAGDWMWPGIWMMPVTDTYGEWPRSGEIDIMESRGNNYTYDQGGNNIVSSALHWGPDVANDAWWRTNNKRQALHTTYSAGPHTYGMEWSEKYIFTYVDSRLLQVLYFDFDSPLYARGAFPLSTGNGTTLVDPWSQTGRTSTPFDTDFYLIINIAIGGTNGWFQDGVSGKPWVDKSPTAKSDFWNAKDQWFPTWQDKGQMIVHSVKMWQQQGYNNC